MEIYGLIGYPLQHSFSPDFFSEKFAREHIDADYKSFPIQDLSELPALIKKTPKLKGLNVTIPYKEKVIPLLDEIYGEAKYVDAVNTIVIERLKNEIKLYGYNTDVFGFEQSLLPRITKDMTKALILGTGGTAKTVSRVLEKQDIDHTFVTRRPIKEIRGRSYITYEELNAQKVSAHKLIVNTTPLGMYPKVDTYPAIPYEGIGREHLLFDVIYNPGVTKFMQMGKTHGASVLNGMQMLQHQAEVSWEIWNAK